jgi:uncharacterized membrane protein HdeD (DUF308 family)
MSDLIIVTLGILALMTVLSYIEPKLKAIAGFAWIACGLFILYDVNIIFLFLSTSVGLFLLLTGVMELYD